MVSDKKKKDLEKIKKQLADAKVIGMLNMHKLPTRQLQKIKKDLTGRAKIIMARKSLLLLALKDVSDKKPSLSGLVDKVTQVPALMVSEENPFKLYQYLKKNKSPASAKIGDIAISEIKINKGPTSLQPGPAMTQLQSVGIKTGVEGGNIAIMKNVTVAKIGDTITPEMAAVFNMLGLEPMKVGLDITAIWEDGTVYGKDVLDVDEEQFYQDILSAVQNGTNLSLNAGYITSATAEIALQKAFAEARALAIEANILTSDVIGSVLAKAAAEMKELMYKVGNLTSKEQSSEKSESGNVPLPEPVKGTETNASKEEKSKEE